jgi:hypothetical protein
MVRGGYANANSAALGIVASWHAVLASGLRATISGIRIGVVGRAPVAILAALALTGCATTRYVTVSCVTRQQYSELQRAEPPKVGDKLTGQADSDIRIVAGSAIRLRAYSEGLMGVLGGCVDPNTQASGK